MFFPIEKDEKIKCIENNVREHIIEYAAILVFAIILVFYFGGNIKDIYSIWETPDDASYIFNASVIAGYDWKEVFSNVNAYYGFGYSIFLIPLFFVCDTGLELIRGIAIVNTIAVILLYFIQIYIVSRVFKKIPLWLVAIVSMIVCFYPYIFCSSQKAICEICLTLWVWLIALLLYKTLISKKYIYCVLLAIAIVFSYFIHARAITIFAVMMIVIGMAVYAGQVNIKQVGVIFITFVLTFAVFKVGKSAFKNIYGSGILISSQSTMTNIINGQYIADRIHWLLTPENLGLYISGWFGKIFYLTISTAGIILIGIFDGMYSLFKAIKDTKGKVDNETIIMSYFFLVFFSIFVASCLNGTGLNYASYIYGRYYEYSISFIIIWGLFAVIEHRQSWKRALVCEIVTVIAGAITINLSTFSETSEINIDTCRIAGLTYIIGNNKNFITVVVTGTAMSVIFLLIFTVLAHCEMSNYIVPFVLFAWFLVTDTSCNEELDRVNEMYRTDMDLATYITDNIGDNNVWFVYEEYKYDNFFVRLQVFLKDEELKVTLPEDYEQIPKDDFVVVYNMDDTSEQINKGKCIKKSRTFKLFKK